MSGTEGDVELTVRGIHVRLSREHLEVMRRVAQGQTYLEIGQDLGLCAGTIYERVLDVRNALGAQNRTEALLLLNDGIPLLPEMA